MVKTPDKDKPSPSTEIINLLAYKANIKKWYKRKFDYSQRPYACYASQDYQGTKQYCFPVNAK